MRHRIVPEGQERKGLGHWPRLGDCCLPFGSRSIFVAPRRCASRGAFSSLASRSDSARSYSTPPSALTSGDTVQKRKRWPFALQSVARAVPHWRRRTNRCAETGAALSRPLRNSIDTYGVVASEDTSHADLVLRHDERTSTWTWTLSERVRGALALEFRAAGCSCPAYRQEICTPKL